MPALDSTREEKVKQAVSAYEELLRSLSVKGYNGRAGVLADFNDGHVVTQRETTEQVRRLNSEKSQKVT